MTAGVIIAISLLLMMAAEPGRGGGAFGEGVAGGVVVGLVVIVMAMVVMAMDDGGYGAVIRRQR